MKAGTLDACDCKFISETEQSTDDKFQMEIKYKLIVLDLAFNYYKRFVFTGSHWYQITIGGISNKSAQLISNKNKFFKSFHIKQ